MDDGWQSATPASLGQLMKEGRTQRRLAAQDRRKEKAIARANKIEALRQAIGEAQHGQMVRQVMRDLGLDKPDRAWGRTFRIRVPQRNSQRTKKHGRSVIKPSRVRALLPSYKKALLDSRGREAVFLNISYVGRNSKGWRPGIAADHAAYCGRYDALEEPEQQFAEPISNVALTPEECTDFWKAVEPVELGYRANAKVQYRFVGALPHEMSAEQRRLAVRHFCERSFGRYGLGYTAYIHTPDPDGDSRNFHFHVLISQRQCARVGENEWVISEEKFTEIFTPEGLKDIRFNFAAALNRGCNEAGLKRRFTHLSYRERGLDAARTEKLGAARTAAFRKGETVAMAERNRQRITANVAGVRAQFLRGQIALAEFASAEAKRVQNQIARSVMLAKLREQIAAVSMKANRVSQPSRALTQGPHKTGQDSREAPLEVSMSGATDRQIRKIDPTLVAKIKNVAAASSRSGILNDTTGLAQPIPRAAYSHLVAIANTAKHVDELVRLTPFRRLPHVLRARVGLIALRGRNHLSGSSRARKISLGMRGHLHRISTHANIAVRVGSLRQNPRAHRVGLRNVLRTATAMHPLSQRPTASTVARIAMSAISARGSSFHRVYRQQDFASEAAVARHHLQRVADLLKTTSKKATAPTDELRHPLEAKEDWGRNHSRSAPSSTDAERAASDSKTRALDEQAIALSETPRAADANGPRPEGLPSNSIVTRPVVGGTSTSPPAMRAVPDGSDTPTASSSISLGGRPTTASTPAERSPVESPAPGIADHQPRAPDKAAPPVAGEDQRPRSMLLQAAIAAWVDEEFNILPGVSSRTRNQGGRDPNRAYANTAASAELRNVINATDAAFCRSVIPQLCKHVDANAVDEGDEAIIAKLPEGQRNEALNWTSHPLWHLVLQGLRQGGKRHTEAVIDAWHEARDAKGDGHLPLAWHAVRQLKRWPTYIDPGSSAHLAGDAAKHQEMIRRQAALSQNRGW